MIYIAHRGLFEGPDKDKENNPEQIDKAVEMGYDVELDVWWINNKWFLGHDGPTYQVDFEYINQRDVWAHCKNLDALYHIGKQPVYCHYFWHQEDDFTLTNSGKIWTYPGRDLTNNSIAVVPERCENYWKYVKNVDIFGVCTDYVNKFINETSTLSIRSAEIA
jgi:hypothetical protein